LYAIISEDKIKDSNITLTFFNTHEQTEDTIVLQVDTSSIKTSEKDFEFQLAARRYIDFTKRFGKEDLKDEIIIQTSLEYQVLSHKTSFFGKIKTNNKSKEEMKTIEIPIKSLDVHSQVEDFRSLGYSGGRQRMMMR